MHGFSCACVCLSVVRARATEVGATIELNHFEALCLSMRCKESLRNEREKKTQLERVERADKPTCHLHCMCTDIDKTTISFLYSLLFLLTEKSMDEQKRLFYIFYKVFFPHFGSLFARMHSILSPGIMFHTWLNGLRAPFFSSFVQHHSCSFATEVKKTQQKNNMQEKRDICYSFDVITR